LRQLTQMNIIQEIKGDLLLVDADVLVQQCNCLTIKSAGLAKAIADRLGVDPYRDRKPVTANGNIATQKTSGVPGTVSWYPIENGNKNVACLFAQYCPGKVNRYPYYRKLCDERGIDDSASARLAWFAQCLEILAKQVKERQLTRVAFPCGIGCGLAGGRWSEYNAVIAEWAKTNPDLDVVIVKL